MISKKLKNFFLFFETNFPYLDLTNESCSEDPLISVVLDIGEKAKGFILIPLYFGLEVISRMIDDSERSSVPLFIGEQNT